MSVRPPARLGFDTPTSYSSATPLAEPPNPLDACCSTVLHFVLECNLQDTLREDCDSSDDCVRNCCVSRVVAPVFFVVFVLVAQFVLVNVVVAVLMKHLEVQVSSL